MSRLVIYSAADASKPLRQETDPAVIGPILNGLGVRYEHVDCSRGLAPGADQAAVLAAYEPECKVQREAHGYQSADVVRIPRGTPDTAPLRAKFLSEHTHSEDEARLMVEGSGAFYLHVGDQVVQVVCEAGDLISVPAGVKHWFDMGADPFFCAIRFFTRPDGWVAEFTGDTISDRFPKYEPVYA